MDIMKSLENFQKESLRQLNEILSRVNVIEKRIDDTGQEEEDPAATELEHVLPMKNIDQLRGLETKLKDKTYFIQVVNILKRIGGSDVYSVVVGILKRLLTNELAEQYSWAGAKKKLPFKDLTLFKLILETVRTHYPSTETEVGQLVAKWLVQARLRRERAEQGKFPYCIVEFTEGKNHVEVVPSFWIELSEGDEGETACWWPDDNCSKHVLRKTSPDSSWNLVKVKIVHFSRSHNNAMNSCKTSEIFTDIDMYSEEDMESSKEKCKETKSRLRSRASLPSTSNNVQSSALLPAISPSSSYHLPSLSSCKNYNGDDDRLTKVLEYTTTLTHDVSQIRIDVSKICNHLNLNSLNIDLQDLPAKTGAELHELEKRLHHSEEFEKLVCFLGRHGGRDISDCTRRILSALMTNETSLTFNWVGGFGKKPFRNFKMIVQMITVSVRQNPNMKHAKMSDVENIIKKWLRYAGDRDGGRSKRKAKKVSNQEQ